ncbi:hypothetical protein OAH91_00370 [Emcibacteraceae bacterium]|nr:hypothetical protein [Emcibacteraceae bacterium]
MKFGADAILVHGLSQNIINIFHGIISSFGSNSIIVKAAQKDENVREFQKTLSASIIILFCLSGLVSAVFIVVPDILYSINLLSLDQINLYGQYINLLPVCFIMGGVGVIFISVANGLQRNMLVIFSNIFSVSISGLICLWLIYSSSITVAWAFPIYVGLIGLFQVVFVLPEFIRNIEFDKPEVKNFIYLAKMASMPIASAILTPLTMIYIRQSMVDVDVSGAQKWEILRIISNIFSSLLISYFSLVMIPRLAKMKNMKDIIECKLQNILSMSIVFFPTAIGIFLFSDFVYYVIAGDLIKPTGVELITKIVGEYIRVLNWVLSLFLLPLLMTRIYILTSFFYAVIHISLTYVLLNLFQYNPVLLQNAAYFISNLLFLCYLIWLLKHKREERW